MPPRSRKADAAADTVGEGDYAVTLAHPLSSDWAKRLGLGEERIAQGTEVRFARPENVRSLITAGYAAVDPEDPTAVAKALAIPDAEAERLVDAMVGTSEPQTPAT